MLATGFVLGSCAREPKGFDKMGLLPMEVGEVPRSFLKNPPTRVGEITWHRTELNGQVIAAVRTEGPCPRQIHTVAGAVPRKDAIELCFSATPTDAPVPHFPCSTDVYVKYEILAVPKDVEPKFVFKGDCFDKRPEPGLGASSPATPPSP